MKKDDAVDWVIDRYKEGMSHQQIRLKLIEAGYKEKQIERLFIKAFEKTRKHPVKEKEVPFLRRYGISFFVGGIFGLLFMLISDGEINLISTIGCLLAGIFSHRIIMLKKTDIRYEFFEQLNFVLRSGLVVGFVYWFIFLLVNQPTTYMIIWLVLFVFIGAVGAGLSYIIGHKAI